MRPNVSAFSCLCLRLFRPHCDGKNPTVVSDLDVSSEQKWSVISCLVALVLFLACYFYLIIYFEQWLTTMYLLRNDLLLDVLFCAYVMLCLWILWGIKQGYYIIIIIIILHFGDSFTVIFCQWAPSVSNKLNYVKGSTHTFSLSFTHTEPPHQVNKQTCRELLKEVPCLQLALIALKPWGKCMEVLVCKSKG